MYHFLYCSSVWHHCLKSDSKKLERLPERALRYLYSDVSSQNSTLFHGRIGYSLMDRLDQNLSIIVFKAISNYPPEYLRDLFRLRDNIKNLRGVNKLQVSKPNMTCYGKNSVKHYHLKQDFWYLKIAKHLLLAFVKMVRQKTGSS